MVVMVLVSCGSLSGAVMYVGSHLKSYGQLMNPDPMVLVPSSDVLVCVLYLAPFSFDH